MKSPVNPVPKSRNRLKSLGFLPLMAVSMLGGCAASGGDLALAPAPSVARSGPAADYPVVVGDPYTIGSTVWTPADQLNYDAVGYASVGADGPGGVSAAHKTLPLPSYVEVTALDTGKTALVRIERRGPMVNDTLVELSQSAAAELGIPPGSRASVRVRRVNPPEQERAMLRLGGEAPARMDTPEALLKVLRRKLAEQSPLLPPPSTPPAMPREAPAGLAKTAKTAIPVSSKPKAKPAPVVPEKAPIAAVPAVAAAASPKARPPAPAPTVARRGFIVVQVAALSSEANARKLAAKLGGQVSKAGRFWRVQIGPFADRGQAQPALEKARSAGYKDARILSAD